MFEGGLDQGCSMLSILLITFIWVFLCATLCFSVELCVTAISQSYSKASQSFTKKNLSKVKNLKFSILRLYLFLTKLELNSPGGSIEYKIVSIEQPK
jgi:hypothetical protein